jgi:hypothetical protein
MLGYKGARWQSMGFPCGGAKEQAGGRFSVDIALLELPLQTTATKRNNTRADDSFGTTAVQTASSARTT